VPDVVDHLDAVEDGQPAGEQLVQLGKEPPDPLVGVHDDDPTTTGRSSLKLRIRLVWMWLAAPNPSNPRKTVAPASPAAWARCTISV
jgi:hypothetical protein